MVDNLDFLTITIIIFTIIAPIQHLHLFIIVNIMVSQGHNHLHKALRRWQKAYPENRLIVVKFVQQVQQCQCQWASK